MNQSRSTPLLLSFIFLLLFILQAGYAQGLAPAPAPATSDGTAIDQGIAYILLFVALALTYLLH